MGGGLISYLPEVVKAPLRGVRDAFREMLGIGTHQTPTKTAQATQSARTVHSGAKEKTNAQLDSIVNAILKRYDKGKDEDGAVKLYQAYAGNLTPDMASKIRIQLAQNGFTIPQGKTSNKQPTHTEVGYTHIANSGVPELGTSSAVETGAYHNKYENQGDPNVTGISPNDVRLRAHKEALIAGTIPMSEHTENLEIVLGSKERAQNSIAENQNQYDQVSDCHKNR